FQTWRHAGQSKPPGRRALARRNIGGVHTAALLLAVLLFAACTSSPVRAARIDASDVHRRLTRSALSTGEVSLFTRNILLEANLVDLFDDDPEKALEQLHDLAV